MSISHINKHIILQSHKHIAPTRSFNRDLHCFLLILKLRHILYNVQIYYMYSLYPFLHFFLPSFHILTIYSLLVFIYIWRSYRRRKWQPTPVFWPGESYGQRSLVGCCPWGRTESDTTEATEQQQQLFLYIEFTISLSL